MVLTRFWEPSLKAVLINFGDPHMDRERDLFFGVRGMQIASTYLAD